MHRRTVELTGKRRRVAVGVVALLAYEIEMGLEKRQTPPQLILLLLLVLMSTVLHSQLGQLLRRLPVGYGKPLLR
jgi:hypothetical protein